MSPGKRRASLPVIALALLAGCRDVQQAVAALPEYCNYTEIGSLCDSYDQAALPYPVALGLRPLSLLDPFDRPIVAAFVAAMSPRPRSARVLAPVPQAWFDEYAAACPRHPSLSEFRRAQGSGG